MSIENVREYFKIYGMENQILEFSVSSATVELAAQALNCDPARIAKTLSFKTENDYLLIVCAGDVKIDNHKYKELFGCKAKMLTPEEVLEKIGHAVGGVCPFGIKDSDVKIYIDSSIQRFETIFPACGSANSAIEFTPDELYKYAQAVGWVDVGKRKEEV